MPITILNAVRTILALVSCLGITYSLSKNVENLLPIAMKVLITGGGWLPLLIFTIHVFLSQVLHLYDRWPPQIFRCISVAVWRLHFLFPAVFNYCLARVSNEVVSFCLNFSATATVFWEFAEFSVDQLLGTNIQLGLANTIKDMAMGILGSILIVLIRVWQLRIGRSELKEIAFDWIHGEAAK
jgi:hypothetical protein